MHLLSHFIRILYKPCLRKCSEFVTKSTAKLFVGLNFVGEALKMVGGEKNVLTCYELENVKGKGKEHISYKKFLKHAKKNVT